MEKKNLEKENRDIMRLSKLLQIQGHFCNYLQGLFTMQTPNVIIR